MSNSNLRCDDVLPLIEKLADGECSPEERTRAEAHVRLCGSCREHLEFLRTLPQAMKEASPSEPPDAYWQQLPRKIMERIGREPHADRRRPPGSVLATSSGLSSLRWWAAVAAALVAAVVGREVMLSTDPSTREPSRAELTAPESPPGSRDPVPGPGVETPRRQEATEAAPEPAEPRSLEQTVRGGAIAPLAEAPSSPSETERAERPEEMADSRSFQEGEGKEANEDDLAPPATLGRTGETGGRVAPKAETESEMEEERLRRRAVGVRGEEELRVGDQPPPRAPFGGKLSSADEDLGIANERTSAEDCEIFRRMLADEADRDVQLEIRYRLAQCSIRRYEARPDDETRRQALEDAFSFVELGPEDPRAEAIRRELRRLGTGPQNRR